MDIKIHPAEKIRGMYFSLILTAVLGHIAEHYFCKSLGYIVLRTTHFVNRFSKIQNS